MAARATSSGSWPSRGTEITPRGSNCQATAPAPASWPPALVKIERTSAAVRLRLSVAASTRMATPPGPVALVDDLLVLLGLVAAGRLLDGALDVVRGHVGRARLLDREAQTVVRVGVAAARARRDGDLAPDLGEDGAALGVVDALLALDL